MSHPLNSTQCPLAPPPCHSGLHVLCPNSILVILRQSRRIFFDCLFSSRGPARAWRPALGGQSRAKPPGRSKRPADLPTCFCLSGLCGTRHYPFLRHPPLAASQKHVSKSVVMHPRIPATQRVSASRRSIRFKLKLLHSSFIIPFSKKNRPG